MAGGGYTQAPLLPLGLRSWPVACPTGRGLSLTNAHVRAGAADQRLGIVWPYAELRSAVAYGVVVIGLWPEARGSWCPRRCRRGPRCCGGAGEPFALLARVLLGHHLVLPRQPRAIAVGLRRRESCDGHHAARTGLAVCRRAGSTAAAVAPPDGAQTHVLHERPRC